MGLSRSPSKTRLMMRTSPVSLFFVFCAFWVPARTTAQDYWEDGPRCFERYLDPIACKTFATDPGKYCPATFFGIVVKEHCMGLCKNCKSTTISTTTVSTTTTATTTTITTITTTKTATTTTTTTTQTTKTDTTKTATTTTKTSTTISTTTITTITTTTVTATTTTAVCHNKGDVKECPSMLKLFGCTEKFIDGKEVGLHCPATCKRCDEITSTTRTKTTTTITKTTVSTTTVSSTTISTTTITVTTSTVTSSTVTSSTVTSSTITVTTTTATSTTISTTTTVGATLGCNVPAGSGKVFLAAPFELGTDRCKEAVDHAYAVFAGQCPSLLDGVAKATASEDVLTCTPNALAMAPKYRSDCDAVAESIMNLAVALDPTIRGGQGAEITCLGGGRFMSFANVGECKATVAVLNRALHYDFSNETWDGSSSDLRPRPGGNKEGKGKNTTSTAAAANTTSTKVTTKATTVTTTNSSNGDEGDNTNFYVVQSRAYQLCHAPTTVTSTGTSTVTSTMTTTVTTHDAGELFGCDARGHFTTRFDFSTKLEDELTSCFGHARKLNRMIGVCRSERGGAAATPGKMRCDDKVTTEETAADSADCLTIFAAGFSCQDKFLNGESVAALCPKTCKGKGRRALDGANFGKLLRAPLEDVAVLNSILRDFMHKETSFAPLIRDSSGLLQSTSTGSTQDVYGACTALARTLGTAMVFFEANDYQVCDWTTQTSTQTTSASSTQTSTGSSTETSTQTTTATTSATSTGSSTETSTQTTSATTSITSTATTTPITEAPLFKCADFDGESLLTVEGYLECLSTSNLLAGLGRLCTSLPEFTCDGLADGTFALRAKDDASCEEAVTTLASASAGLKIGSLGLKCNGAHVATKSCSGSLKVLGQADAFLDPATLPTVLTWGYECACPKDTAAVHFATGAPLAALERSQSTFETSDLLTSLGAAFDAALVSNVSTGTPSGSNFAATSFNLTGGQVAVDIHEMLEIGRGGVCGTIKTKLQVAVSGTFEFSYAGHNLWAGTEPLKAAVPEPFSGTATVVLAVLAVAALAGLFFVWKKRSAMLILFPPPAKYSASSQSVLPQTVGEQGTTRERTLTNGQFVYNVETGDGVAAADAAPEFIGETDLFGGARGMGNTLSKRERRPSMKLTAFDSAPSSQSDPNASDEKEDNAPQATLAFNVGGLPDIEVGRENAPFVDIPGIAAEDLADDYLADTGNASEDEYSAENRPTNELVNIRRAGSVKRGPAHAKSPEDAEKRKAWQGNFQKRMSQFSATSEN